MIRNFQKLSFTSYQNCSCFISYFKVPGKLLLKSTFGSVKAIPGAAVKSILTLEGCTLLLVFPQYIDNYSIVLQKKFGVVWLVGFFFWPEVIIGYFQVTCYMQVKKKNS